MAITLTFPFTTKSNYSVSQADVSGGYGQLEKLDNTGQTFSQIFENSSGFTFDATKVEFSACQVVQKDQFPDETFFATYTTDENGIRGAGTLTGTLQGSATVTGGKLNCVGNAVLSCDYNASANADSAQVGTYRFKMTPGYTGTPPGNTNFIGTSISSTNRKSGMDLFHNNATGDINFKVFDSACAVIINTSAFGAWSPVSGTEYEFELNYDFTNGESRLFIDGAQAGVVVTATVTRGGPINLLRVGGGAAELRGGDCKFDDVQIFSSVQHTASYSAGLDVVTKYVESEVQLPAFGYTGVGSLQAFSGFSASYSGSVKFTVEGQYWNGSAWVSSNGSYAQASDESSVAANISGLGISSSSVNVSVIFTDSSGSAGANVDTLNVEYTGQKYYTSGNLSTVTEFTAESFDSFSATTINVTGVTNTKFAIFVDGTLKYWDGAAWSNSDGSIAQTNTADEINTNASALISTNSTLKIYSIITTTDVSQTGQIDSIVVSYDFGGIGTSPSTCTIWGYYRDISGQGVSDATVTFTLKRNSKEYKEAADSIVEKKITTTTDSNGYFDVDLIRSSEYEGTGTYIMTITKAASSLNTSRSNAGAKLEITVPDAVTKNITDLLTAL